jgi:hypothetical protein
MRDRDKPRLHVAPAAQRVVSIKCQCRMILEVPVQGRVCLCGRRHIRVTQLDENVRTKTIETEDRGEKRS